VSENKVIAMSELNLRDKGFFEFMSQEVRSTGGVGARRCNSTKGGNAHGQIQHRTDSMKRRKKAAPSMTIPNEHFFAELDAGALTREAGTPTRGQLQYRRNGAKDGSEC
jgi:hypothetical protein